MFARTALRQTGALRQFSTSQSLFKKPSVIVISGPSGSGKSTLINDLLRQYPTRFALSVSHTTRKPRPGEIAGTHYHYVTKEEFDALAAQNGFVEKATFASNSYGTSIQALKNIKDEGKVAILDIEMEGVKQVKASPIVEEARFVFNKAPSMEILEKRLRNRGTETEEAIQKRLAKAQSELDYAETGVHDFVLVNDTVEKAYEDFKEYLSKELDEKL
ncbi:guanylate kinase [Ascobolus immersus RN42]|uniref:Guanylate kinase n=1 Tax=Ascobolus immersus RN42 TaxID=1160509 RepID=A0A3N4I3J0_ASCIM|nr:guanylate kinase [Ascobolus immersus RN42]